MPMLSLPMLLREFYQTCSVHSHIPASVELVKTQDLLQGGVVRTRKNHL